MTPRVLIIDDDPLNRRVVRTFLEAAGYEMHDAGDGPEGLEQAALRHPDAIVLDLLLPGMDGFAVCRRLKANPTTRDIPVIILTTSSDVSLNHQAYDAGALVCLTKPFRREALIAAIRTVLRQTGEPPQEELGKN